MPLKNRRVTQEDMHFADVNDLLYILFLKGYCPLGKKRLDDLLMQMPHIDRNFTETRHRNPIVATVNMISVKENYKVHIEW